MSVLSRDEVKAHLNIALSSTTNDDELDAFIARAEAALSRKIGPLASTTKTERVRGGDSVLWLSSTPVISITSITSPSTGAVIQPSQLTVSSSGQVEYTSYGWFSSHFYDVTYQAGYVTLPADLQLAVLELIRHMWDTQRGGGSARIGSAQSDAMSNTIPGAAYLFPFRVEQLIAPYVPVLGA